MDISLADLLQLESNLSLDPANSGSSESLEELAKIDVTWAVSARVTPPHLPQLRGGEVLLISARAVHEVGHELPALIKEAQARNASALVFEHGEPLDMTYPDSTRLVTLRSTESLTPDTEAAINRHLTEWRGNLYRIGSDLERRLTDLTVSGAGVGPLVRVVAESSGLPVTILDARGREVASAPRNAVPGDGDAKVAPATCLRRGLPFGAEIVFGPLAPSEQVVARFLADRIASAAAAAIQHDDAARPRGAKRDAAVGALLAGAFGSASDQRAAALALGLDPDATFLVAAAMGTTDEALARALAPLGATLAAQDAVGRTALVVLPSQSSPESLAQRVLEVKRRWRREHGTDDASLALSAPSTGVASLPDAAREARLLARLQSRLRMTGRALSFDSVDDVGALRLLYQLRDSAELERFASEALGRLLLEDQRGALRETLSAFLESGGSHVAASARLGIHRNTLAYRLRRIGELVGRDVSDPGTWLTLHLALRASDLLDMSSADA